MSSYIYCGKCGGGWDDSEPGYVHTCLTTTATTGSPMYDPSLPPSAPYKWETKDSGKRQEFSTGMKRDTQLNKPRYDLLDRTMLKRWAGLMERGAVKYGENNWKKAATEEELRRFETSAIRHMFQWLDGETDEDHAAAVLFNVSGAEMVKAKLGRVK